MHRLLIPLGAVLVRPPSAGGRPFRVGDRVGSTYGAEHAGTVAGTTYDPEDAETWYAVQRDSDGFVWIVSVETMTREG